MLFYACRPDGNIFAVQAAIAGFGEGTPQQVSREGQNRRIADFGTVVETCSKKLPDCRSLPTATFSENL